MRPGRRVCAEPDSEAKEAFNPLIRVTTTVLDRVCLEGRPSCVVPRAAIIGEGTIKAILTELPAPFLPLERKGQTTSQKKISQRKNWFWRTARKSDWIAVLTLCFEEF